MEISFKQLVKKAVNRFGRRIIPMPYHPRSALLSLRDLPIRTIIDVGANEGQFAKYITTIFPEAHLYCFEPLPNPYEMLRRWADRQQDKVTAFNVALGNREGTVEMLRHVNHSPSSSLLRSTRTCETLYPFIKKQQPVSVTMASLDEVLSHRPSLHPDILVKLDVQGYEDRVIRGGVKTFGHAKACIVEVCLDVLYEEQATFKDIVLILNGLGYRYAGNVEQIYADDGHVIYLDALFVK